MKKTRLFEDYEATRPEGAHPANNPPLGGYRYAVFDMFKTKTQKTHAYRRRPGETSRFIRELLATRVRLRVYIT